MDEPTADGLITVPVGTTLEQAKELLHRHRIEKLPVVDADFKLKGLITVKDIQKIARFPSACKDVRNLELSRCSPGPPGEQCLSAHAIDWPAQGHPNSKTDATHYRGA